MRTYSPKISLNKNSRGVYIIDPTMGCSSGMGETGGGCYGECYSAKSAKIYGYDFTKTVTRHFQNERHKRRIINQIRRIDMPFVRMGGSGDPSENWEHTLSVCGVISKGGKEIVIITRHWTILTDQQLEYLKTINVCINTSVSALDNIEMLNRSIQQYKRLKPFCKSVLRIVSCDFNLENETGKALSIIQDELFKNESIIDTVFRPYSKSKWIADGIINVKKGVFNGSKQLMSKRNRKTYTGRCGACKEMCGLNIETPEYDFPIKRKVTKQSTLF